MKRSILCTIVLLSLALPGASATPLPVAGLASDNVTYVDTVPLEAGTWSGARVHGDYLYVSGSKSFSIYDITDPVAPELMSHTVTGFQFVNEDVDTNGQILLISDERGRQTLHIWDVSDKTSPVKLAEVPDMEEHTFACVLDCRWAYGAAGAIVDLRDPAKPVVAGRWFENAPALWGFDTNEVAPGLVMTGSRIMHLLDGRRDPANPRVVAQAGTPDNRVIHSTRWPRRGKDRFLLVQGETSPKPRCDQNSGAFMTWDTTGWRKSHSFRMIDEYRFAQGTYADGNPAVNPVGCSPSWFQHHPSFRNGGLVVTAAFEHGTRFLDVDEAGEISESGYFMPLAGSTTAAYWVTDEIVYSIDLTHGIDILRFAR